MLMVKKQKQYSKAYNNYKNSTPYWKQNLDTSMNTGYRDPDKIQAKKPRASKKRKTLQMSVFFNMI